MDGDVTVKPLYGHQEGAEAGYNPHKPGRPSHTCHTYQLSPLRVVLEVEVLSGKENASKYSSPGLWELLNRLPREQWPALIRGDCDWGTEGNMQRAEQEGIPYLFKLRLTSRVRGLIERLMRGQVWEAASQGWEGAEGRLRLQGWGREGRVIVLRRRVQKDLALFDRRYPGQLQLGFAEFTDKVYVYQYSVLVTSLNDEVFTLAQLYRERADAENPFDELKNHWAWGGFTTNDIKRCRFMSKLTALVYDWWSLFVRLANPEQHTEAITSRPTMLYALGKQTAHAVQTCLTLTSIHAAAPKLMASYRRIAAFFRELRATVEQLTSLECWCRILSQALVQYLKGRELRPPPRLLAPT